MHVISTPTRGSPRRRRSFVSSYYSPLLYVRIVSEVLSRNSGSKSDTDICEYWGNKAIATGKAQPNTTVHTTAFTARWYLGLLLRNLVLSTRDITSGGSMRTGAGRNILVMAVSWRALLAAIFDVPTTFSSLSITSIPSVNSLFLISNTLQTLAAATAG